jgi:hypothetical protein
MCDACAYMRLWLAQCEGCGTQNELEALIRAAGRGHADCVRLLLDAGADKNASGDVRGSVRHVTVFACAF